MAQQSLGIDLGTNSIGLSLRNTDLGENIKDQLEYFESIIFESGVGNGKTGEFSYAAERTKFRSTRRNYMARKYRIWATLKLLIDENLCPLTLEQLDRWRRYDKAKDLKRQYPIDAYDFEQWVRLDFDGDGKPDYSSPYQLRAELMERQFDFDNQEDRYKFGRAIYHIAQRRGFKSSKGETKDEQEENANKTQTTELENIDLSESLKKSELKKSKDITAYMEKHGLKTIGCAMAHLEREGVRVRNSIYTPIRAQYKEEIVEIFKFQKGLKVDSDLYLRLTSERKDKGTIFYKRPLRSQKGNVGKCLLEPNRKRCPVSHPEFEKFRAWSVINNIKYRPDSDSEWQSLSEELRQRMFNERFMLSRSYFKFEDLRKWMEKELGLQLTCSRDNKTVNYPDRTSISGCPVCYRLEKIMGPEWQTTKIETDKERVNHKTGETHKVIYNYEDLWHVAMTYEDPEAVRLFAEGAGIAVQDMIGLWNAIQQGYANLSLKAIRNINRFLCHGLIYTDAALLAKIPDIVGQEIWQLCETPLLDRLEQINTENRWQKRMLNIVNDLISRYKMLSIEHQFAYRNTGYQLNTDDHADIERCIMESFRKKEWFSMTEQERKAVRDFVTERYQAFFNSSKREYYKLPQLGEAIRQFLIQWVKDIPDTSWNRLYHPSKIEYFVPVKAQNINIDDRVMSLKLLPRPTLGSIKNPMALRVLHVLRQQINGLLKTGLINSDTKIVVETARELNDANMRWAIKTYQAKNEDANKEIAKQIKNLMGIEATSEDIRKARLLIEQPPKEEPKQSKAKTTALQFEKEISEIIKKYKLWLEQGCRSIYTGEVISITDLLNGDKTDFEHTIPRSLSFDDSLANLTVCESNFNRRIKQNRIPSQLDNYNEILLRIEPWIKKVEHLKDQVEQWRHQSRMAADKDRKDYCIRQMHLWRMELDYWQKKVKTFTMKDDEMSAGFRNSQLVDTRIITKYAYHFLKSAFNNVEVQKGEVTAIFRKILGVQSQDEKKDRSRHSHHAIDATMLTLVPSAAKRDRMLQLFYEIDELKKLDKLSETGDKKKELAHLVTECGVGHADGLAEWIESSILVNHITKDQSLTPARRRRKHHGKEIIIAGDCIRGRLHEESFLGAITQHKGEDIFYVKRRPLTPKKGIFGEFKDWEDLLSCIVNKDLVPMMKSQFPEGTSFESACNSGIYMLDKNGEKVNKIRHIRCYVSIKNPAIIKEQTYPSKKEYKNHYYAKNGEITSYALYWDGTIGSPRGFDTISLLDIAKIKTSIPITNKKEAFAQKNDKGIPLYCAITPGKTHTILFRNDEFQKNDGKEEIVTFAKSLSQEELSKRLYLSTQAKSNDGRIKFIHHLESRDDKTLEKEYGKAGKDGFSDLDINNPHPKLFLSKANLTMLVEHLDFEFDVTGKIIFL